MATVVAKDGTLKITDISDDWDYYSDFDWKAHNWPAFPRLLSIEYHPGGTDVMVIKNGSTGIDCFYARTENYYDSRIKYFHGTKKRPFIDYASCTLNAGHQVIIELWRE